MELAVQREEAKERISVDLHLSELVRIRGPKSWKDGLRHQLEGLEYQVQGLGLLICRQWEATGYF